MSANVLAPFLSWLGMRRSAAWRGCRTLTLAAGAMLAVVASWLAMCHYGNLDRSACPVGVAQRLFMGSFYVWVEVVAIRLWNVGAAAEPVYGLFCQGAHAERSGFS